MVKTVQEKKLSKACDVNYDPALSVFQGKDVAVFEKSQCGNIMNQSKKMLQKKPQKQETERNHY